jgi:hypothetical protein
VPALLLCCGFASGGAGHSVDRGPADHGSRTVDAGRPASRAARRSPAPPAAASSAAPISVTASALRSRHHADSSTCVAPHPRHLGRREAKETAGLHPFPTRSPFRPAAPPGTPPNDSDATPSQIGTVPPADSHPAGIKQTPATSAPSTPPDPLRVGILSATQHQATTGVLDKSANVQGLSS